MFKRLNYLFFFVSTPDGVMLLPCVGAQAVMFSKDPYDDNSWAIIFEEKSPAIRSFFY